MARKTAADFHPEVLSWFNRYIHGEVDRRGFLTGVAKYAVGGVTATMLLEALSPNYALAQQVAGNDPRISATYSEFPSPEGHGKGRGYLARPANPAGRLPGVLVIHENRGLNPHIEDIARRLALDNFVAFAPDALFPQGGYPGDDERAAAMFAKLDQTKTGNDFVAAAQYLKGLPECSGKIGAVGFCWGGGIANMLGTRLPDLGAAVPFYGPVPPAADVVKIKAALMLQFADNDGFVNPGWPGYEAALKAAGVKYEAFFYPGTGHGFNNDTTPRYNAAAAKLAWSRTVEFFNKQLRG
jgi:carboxymethylenebutenolidase